MASVPTTATYHLDGLWCGVTGHSTQNGGRYFEHYHFSDVFAQGNTYVTLGNGVLLLVNSSATRDYWDNHYGNDYSPSGSEDSSYNCWGYALGYSVWVENPAKIYDDDYESVSVPSDGCVIRRSGHIIVVEDAVAGESAVYVYKTREKTVIAFYRTLSAVSLFAGISMKRRIKQITIFVVAAVLLILPFAVFRLLRQTIPETIAVEDDEFVKLHHERIKELTEKIRRENLKESFSNLIEEPQYLYPGYIPPNVSPWDMEALLSARRFLKVKQTFQSLSKKEAKQFQAFASGECRRLLELAISRLQTMRGDPSAPPNGISFHSLRLMFLTTMLMAVELNDKQTVFALRDFWENSVNAQIEYMNIRQNEYPDKQVLTDAILKFDDSAFLTVLLHLVHKLKAENDLITPILQECEKGKDTSDVPNAKDIPLVKWDAPDSYYDVPIRVARRTINPNDITQRFAVYYFPSKVRVYPEETKKRLQTIRQVLGCL
ncbi:MAG: hypothetical protein LBT46_09655 [Planctomycetaceae bacterium]|nr:hypothetical protein [Planctomycetaceae bacterium]